MDDSEEDRIAELSNDMYAVEILLDRFKDECDRRIKHIRSEYLADEHESLESQIAVGVADSGNTYPNLPIS